MMLAMGTKVLRTVVAFALMTAETAVVSHAQSDAPVTRIDHASVYQHYMLARMYAAKSTKSHDSEDAKKAVENYKAAIKADPEAAIISEELAAFERAGRSPVRIVPVYLSPTK